MTSTAEKPKPKRRWCQFSLKTLLLVMLVFSVTVGCMVGWVRYRQQRARENRARVAAVEEAMAAMEKLGGKVTSSYEKLRPQTWLEEQFDDPGDADDPVGVRKVTAVNFWYCRVNDADLEHLKGLEDHLQELDLSHTNVTNAGLEQLKGLTNLRVLDLSDTGVSSVGLEHLKGLPNLRELTLFDNLIGEAGLKSFRQASPKCRIWHGSVAP